MAEDGSGVLEALQSLHGLLLSVVDRPKDQRLDLPQVVGPSLDHLGDRIATFLDKRARSKTSRDAVISGKIQLNGEEYQITKEFQELALQVADEIDLDELEASRLILETEDDERLLGRPRRECALIRFHQQRKYLLDCVRLLLELSKIDEVPEEVEDWLGAYVAELILGSVPSAKAGKLIPRCMAAMRDIRAWQQRIADQVAKANVLGQATLAEFRETIEFSNVSLVQQHELVAVILSYAVEKRVGTPQDFVDFFALLKTIDRYDSFTVHLFPALGSFITVFGSTEGNGDLTQARKLNEIVCKQSDDDSRSVPYFRAAVKAWWLAEYSGWYVDDAAGSQLQGIDIDAEDAQRARIFTDALKDGAFDLLMAVVADVQASDWQDPARIAIRQWLQRKTPPLPADAYSFSDFFQKALASQVEMFVDAFISNLPDILRKLRVEEDEQRQMNHAQEQDVDLERFLMIIAFSYEGRPEAADAFWGDPDSHLAGFLQWASRRASTPLVSAFCEMLQSLSEDAESATSAHEFLLDDGFHASGKMRKNLSLTWPQIFKELDFFTKKIREKQNAPPQPQGFKAGRFNHEPIEAELESAMMLECYLRLIAKVASNSEAARLFLLDHQKPNLLDLVFTLVSSHVPGRLRACAFNAVSALLARKTLDQSMAIWNELDACLSGAFIPPSTSKATSIPQSPALIMESLFEEMSPRFEEAGSFIQLLSALSSLPEGYEALRDTLPFAESLGAATRVRPGIEPYIDFALGHVFGIRSQDSSDVPQQRILRYQCLEFALTCLTIFNEDLIIFANETAIPVDSAIAPKDLATYVTLHPFARVMDWMYDANFMKTLLSTVHQEASDVGSAAPDSPLILSILRAVELITKALELQPTYLDLVRPLVKAQARAGGRSMFTPVSNFAFGSIEDGLMTSLNIISDLGSYCGIGHTDLTLASLKLLQKISTSSIIISAWQHGSDRPSRRNKAIVALEDNGFAESIAGSFISEMGAPLDMFRQAESASYQTKVYILDFLYSCIRANPDRPTVAHLLLGFHCDATTIGIAPGSPFTQGTSLFHSILGIPVELPITDEQGCVRTWLIDLKYKAMRIFQALWSSRLSSQIVLDQLRENDFLFHLLLQGLVVQPSSLWDGLEPAGPDFLIAPSSHGYVDYLSIRAMALEYITHEVCSVSQSQLPALKRRVFDALSGQISVDGGEAIPVASIFEFHDFLPQETQFVTEPPELKTYRDLDIRVCLEADIDGDAMYNLNRVKEIIHLKRNATQMSGQMISQQDLAPIEVEEEQIQLYAAYLNRFKQVNGRNHKVLNAWTKLLMIMTETNDFKGTNRVSFILQVLQAILPSLEMYGLENPTAAFELVRLAKVLIFNLDFSLMSGGDKQSRAIGSLVSDKLFQLFQISLNAVAKWSGTAELRTLYYSICYRYITALVDHGSGLLSGRQKTAKMIQVFGERLMNVLCDDASGGDAACQTAALILLGTLVNLGRNESDNYVVDMLNRLNFIGVLVDSLRHLMDDWMQVNGSGNSDQLNYQNAKLALLLQLCQTREGAKNVLHANLFRSIEASGLFAADPELQVDPSDYKALEKHYALLVKVSRIIGAAIVSRSSHNVGQGRRFLTEHRMLVMHVLKRSAGIGNGTGKMEAMLDDKIQDLAEALMVIIMATGFLEFESEAYQPPETTSTPVLFH